MAMTLQQALEILAQNRGDRIVVTTMASIGVWPKLSDTPLDFSYMPSAMGEGPALGMGLAMAHPERGVIVLNGDGSMLMNLGSLVTLANHPTQLFLVIIDNGIYEITGGQTTAGTGHVNFAEMARAAGVSRVERYSTVESWQIGAASALSGLGPVVICLDVEGRKGQGNPVPPRPIVEQIQQLQEALQKRE